MKRRYIVCFFSKLCIHTSILFLKMNRNYVIILPSNCICILPAGKKGKYKSFPYTYIYLRLLSASKFKLYPSPHFVHLLAWCFLFLSFFFLFHFFQSNRSKAQPSVHPLLPIILGGDEWWPWLKTAVYPRDVLAVWHKINITLFASAAFRKSRNKSKPFTTIKRTFWEPPWWFGFLPPLVFPNQQPYKL